MGAHKLFRRVALALLAGMVMGSAHARTVTLDHLMPTVRLCPVSCVSVSGHKLRNGSKVQVLQVRSGWARVSPWLDAERLKRSFGERVPEKPAYWVELARTSGLQAASRRKVKEAKVKAQSQKVVARQERRVTVPVARPGSTIVSLQSAENSMIVNALAADPLETTKAADAVVEKMKSSVKPTTSLDGSPVRVSAPDNPSDRALTTDKMAEWIAANRGEVIEGVKDDVTVAEPDQPIATGKAMEEQIVALKSPSDTESGFGRVPDVMTTELLDKRLNILPGMNSNIPEETVIALRHYALGLLDNGTCKGIAGGGAGETAGTIYLVCTDDLTKTREFPLASSAG